MKNFKFKAILILLSVLSIALYSCKELTEDDVITTNNGIKTNNDIQSSGSSVIGVMQNGVPVVTVPFADLDNEINTLAISEGYLGGSLVSQHIVDEGVNGHSFVFRYTLIVSPGVSECGATSMPIELVDDEFIPNVQNGGGSTVVTCKSGCCDGGCTPVNGDCSPCGPDSSAPTCDKIIVNASGGFDHWDLLIGGAIAWLLNKL